MCSYHTPAPHVCLVAPHCAHQCALGSQRRDPRRQAWLTLTTHEPKTPMTLEPPHTPLVDPRPSLSSSPGKTTSKTQTTKEKKKSQNQDFDEQNSILSDKQLAIQVGAFTDHRNAKSLTQKLSDFQAYIERTFVNNKYLYRVRIGPIESLNLAENIKNKLFELGYTASHLIVN